MDVKKRYKFAMYHADGNEYIEGVAISYTDGTIEILKRPYRHHDIIRKVFDEYGKHTKTMSGVQGFYTNTGRFVSRQEARLIAIDAGQVKPENTIHKTLLFSEDLW